MASDISSPELTHPRARRRIDWREGGRTVKPWDESVLAIALVALGLALLAAAAIRGFDPDEMASTVADSVVLVGMLAAVIIAFLRAKPRPLLRFRSVDLLYGLVFGVILRFMQGWFAVAAGDSGALPTLGGTYKGNVWMFADAGLLVLISPAVEEFFFRGVLLVAAYSVVRRKVGRTPAVLAAFALSTAASIATHAWTTGISWEAWVTPLVVGLVCATLVLASGRVWGAVVVHFVFNAAYVLLALIGASWS